MTSMETAMYRLKPLFDVSEIKINSPIYKIKNIQVEHDISMSEDSNRPSNNTLNKIEGKQAALLKQINEIKELLGFIKSKIAAGMPSSETSNSQRKPDLARVSILHEVVLNASIKNPPNSILLLKKLWPDINFLFSWHIHSSVKGCPKALKKFESITGDPNANGTGLKIRVVWKEVWSDCELIVSPLNAVPLLGEANFLRFLNNCVNTKSKLNEVEETYFDTKLDACYCLNYCENIQQFQDCYTILSEGLDKNKWMTGNELSIVDVACWSAISNLKSVNLTSSLMRWYKDCDALLNK